MSALPDFDVLALLPCLETKSSEEARIDEVVLTLKVSWESPPVPTMSHCVVRLVYVHQSNINELN
jgi:hypothetical protein